MIRDLLGTPSAFAASLALTHRQSLGICAQVILGKGVDEGRILFLTLIAAPEGIHRICRTFPRVKVQVIHVRHRAKCRFYCLGICA